MKTRQQRDARWYATRLAEPHGPVRLVIDTDAANEIDDQFALAWALLSPQALRIEAVYAAPFSFAHRRDRLPAAPADAPQFNPPGEGMRRSLEEILRVFSLAGVPPDGRVFAGSERYLGAGLQAVRSPAVEHLIECARATPEDRPLHVLALGCVTNIASALLLAPDIAERIVVVWTSGYPSTAPHVNDSFNLEQDLPASQFLLDCGVPLVYLPGFHVGAQLRLSSAEVAQHVQGKGPLGNALAHLFNDNPLWRIYPVDTRYPYSWVMWDLICIAWVLAPQWVPSTLVATPRLDGRRRWQQGQGRHPMREGYAVERDAIFNDLFAKLTCHSSPGSSVPANGR